MFGGPGHRSAGCLNVHNRRFARLQRHVEE
jgi:hypothetical protein